MRTRVYRLHRTPLLKKDKATSMEVFGGYIHTYKFSEAVADEVVLDRKSKWSIAKLSLTKRGDRQSSAAQKPAGFLELRRSAPMIEKPS